MKKVISLLAQLIILVILLAIRAPFMLLGFTFQYAYGGFVRGRSQCDWFIEWIKK